MDKEEKITTKELIKLIALGSLIIGSLVTPGLPRAFLLFDKKKKKNLYFNRRLLKMQIKRLKAREIVNVNEKDDETIVTLTDKGKETILRYNFEDLQIDRPEYWDGKWRMVIFDIPNEFKKERDILREKLKLLGFYKLQESVFIFPFACEREIKFIREYLGTSEYVLFLTFKQLEGKNLKLARNEFDL